MKTPIPTTKTIPLELKAGFEWLMDDAKKAYLRPIFIYDRPTSICLMVSDTSGKVLSRGISVCSDKDQYNRKLGRYLATRRALVTYLNNKEVDQLSQLRPTGLQPFEAEIVAKIFQKDKTLDKQRKDVLVVHEGQMLYDPELDQFRQIRKIVNGVAYVSFANFWNDAKTSISAHKIPVQDLSQFIAGTDEELLKFGIPDETIGCVRTKSPRYSFSSYKYPCIQLEKINTFTDTYRFLSNLAYLKEMS